MVQAGTIRIDIYMYCVHVPESAFRSLVDGSQGSPRGHSYYAIYGFAIMLVLEFTWNALQQPFQNSA